MREERAGKRSEAASASPDLDAAAIGLGGVFDHVAIAVADFSDVAPLLELVTGRRASEPERVPAQGVEVRFAGSVELIRPLEPGGAVGRFVARRGPGLHHVAYRVADLEGAMARLAARGRTFTAPEPMPGARGHRVAFLHPASTGGVLIELLERPRAGAPS